MNILLVAINTVTTPFPVYPLGMAVVANILTKNNYSVYQFDFLTSNKSYNKLKQCIYNFKPKIIAISIRNVNEYSLEISNKIIEISKNLKITTIIGGSACTSDTEYFTKTKADFIFVGPAESNILKFLNDFKNNILPKNRIIPRGTYTKLYGPLYDKKILEFYSKIDSPAIGLNTKRGCRYNCLNCVYTQVDGKDLRYRDINEIIEDIKFLKRNNINKFCFADSIINDNLSYVTQLLTKLKEEKINITWYADFRPDNINKELFMLMSETGLKEPAIGVYGTTDETLLGYNKGFQWKDVVNIDKLLLECNCTENRAYFMFGGPRETKKTVIEGINNIKSLHFSKATIYFFEPILKETYKDICTLDTKWIENKLHENFDTLVDINLKRFHKNI